MNIIKLIGGPVDANCYVITFKKQAIVIDPCVKIDLIKKVLSGYNLAFVILTHGHYDHFCSLEELINYYNVKTYLTKQAIEKLEDANKNCSSLLGMPYEIKLNNDQFYIVNDYEKVQLDENEICFMRTPGHTDCSICVRINDCLFTGDTLFRCGIGRCDLYSGNSSKMMDTLEQLKQYFIKQNKELTIYPGHEEISSSNYELANNPYF